MTGVVVTFRHASASIEAKWTHHCTSSSTCTKKA